MAEPRLTEDERRGMERAAGIADAFADENFRMATDTIFADPLLTAARRRERYIPTETNEKLIEECQINGCIHSSMAHAAQNIAAAIRAALDSQ